MFAAVPTIIAVAWALTPERFQRIIHRYLPTPQVDIPETLPLSVRSPAVNYEAAQGETTCAGTTASPDAHTVPVRVQERRGYRAVDQDGLVASPRRAQTTWL